MKEVVYACSGTSQVQLSDFFSDISDFSQLIFEKPQNEPVDSTILYNKIGVEKGTLVLEKVLENLLGEVVIESSLQQKANFFLDDIAIVSSSFERFLNLHSSRRT
jgi:hypothetical protein